MTDGAGYFPSASGGGNCYWNGCLGNRGILKFLDGVGTVALEVLVVSIGVGDVEGAIHVFIRGPFAA